MYVWMYGCMYVWMYVCVYLCWMYVNAGRGERHGEGTGAGKPPAEGPAQGGQENLGPPGQLRLPQEWRLVQRQVRQLRAQLNGNR